MGRHRLPLAARRSSGRVFYGWWITVACAAMVFVTVGVGYYGLAVFLRPLRNEHGWSNGVVSGATGLYFSLSGLTAAVVGPRIDRRGPLNVLLGGAFLLGASVACLGLIEEVWHLYAVYTVEAVAYGLCSGVAINAILARWFVFRRARAMSVAMTGVSAGGAVLAPLGTWLIDRSSIEVAAVGMAVLIVVVAVPVIRLVLVWDPSEMGLEPDGGWRPAVAPAAAGALSREAQYREWTRREASRTAAFWAILVGYVFVLTAQTGFLIHQISFLEDRFGSRSRAAFALSTTAIGSIVARLAVGTFADRVDKRLLTAALFVLQGAAVLGVVAVDGTALTYVLVLVIGFTIGNVYMMQSLLVSEVFGLVSFGSVFGVIMLAGQVGSGLGPFGVGWLEDVTGGYATPFVVTACLTFAGALCILAVRPVAAPVASLDVAPEGLEAIGGT